MMILKNLQGYNPMRIVRSLITAVIIILLPALIYSQGIQKLDIYKMVDVDSPVPDSIFLVDIIKWIQDTLFLGGGELSNPQYIGNAKGVGLFRDGDDIGFGDGLILSNGYVGTSIIDGGTNKDGHQAVPVHDSLGAYISTGGAGEVLLKDPDMDYIAGIINGTFPMKPDTAFDPSVIMFKFKPYYNSIHLTYVFASEEYEYIPDPGIFPPLPTDPNDVNFTGNSASDFMGVIIRRYPSEMMNINAIASLIGRDGTPSWMPVSVKYLLPTPIGYLLPNYSKSVIFDHYSIPMDIRPFAVIPDTLNPYPIKPCKNYWVKIAVADYPNGVVMGGYNLSHQINSAVFLKAYSLMSGDGLEWSVDGAVSNNDFASDTSLVEGGCSDFILKIHFSVLPRDSMPLLFKISNASLSEFIVEPPLIQDSLIMIPDSVMDYTLRISAINDGINEGTGGIENWFIRYQMDPCDVPTPPDTLGGSTAGYSGLIKVKVRDHNPFNDTTKIYGPTLPPPSSQYHCGGDVTVTIADILTGGIPPYTYFWTNPPGQLGGGANFTTTILDSPDYAYCTIKDRCSGIYRLFTGKDTVEIRSYLDGNGFPQYISALPERAY